MPSSTESIVAPRNRKMCFAWMFAAFVLLGLALFPWISVFATGNANKANWISCGVMLIWSTPITTLAAWIAFNAMCQIELESRRGEICRRKSLGPVSFSKHFDADHLSLDIKMVHRKNGVTGHQVLYVYNQLERRQVLLWDLDCRDLKLVGTEAAKAGEHQFSDRTTK